MDASNASPGHGERLMALAAVITAVAGLVAAIKGVHQRRRARRKRRVAERLKKHVRAGEIPLDSDNKPDRMK